MKHGLSPCASTHCGSSENHMRNWSTRAIVGLMIAFAVVASSCGDKSNKAAPASSSSSSSTTTESTTTTLAPGPPGPLTGLPVADEAAAKRPALIMKIDNSDGGTCEGTARPQIGLNQADIVIEELFQQFFGVVGEVDFEWAAAVAVRQPAGIGDFGLQ